MRYRREAGRGGGGGEGTGCLVVVLLLAVIFVYQCRSVAPTLVKLGDLDNWTARLDMGVLSK